MPDPRPHLRSGRRRGGDPRDQRLIRLYGRQQLARMRRSRVGVFGVGLLGGRLALELGALGVPLLLVDPGHVEPPNTANQLFPSDSVDRPKVLVRAEQIRALYPPARIETKVARVEDVGLGAYADLALMLAGLDGRAARVHVGTISQRLERQYIDTAVDGSGRRLLGVVGHWDPTSADAPCPACRYTAPEMNRIRTEGRGPGCPSWSEPDAVVTPPTLTAASFGMVVAGLASTWAIDVLLGRGASHANARLRISADGVAHCEQVSVARSRHCTQLHERFGALPRVASCSLEELWSEATRRLGDEPDDLLVPSRTFVVTLPCASCGHGKATLRIAGAFRADIGGCACPPGAPPRPTRVLARLTRAEMLRFSTATWSEIGLPDEDVVTARRGTKQIHVVVGRRPADEKEPA